MPFLHDYSLLSLTSNTGTVGSTNGVIIIIIIIYIYIYICSFKTSGDAFRLPYSIAFDCSIRPFLDLFPSWLYIYPIFPSSSGTASFFPSFRFPKFYILLNVHHVMILGKWSTWCTNSFLCIYFYLQLSTCFEHTVLIIRRDKLCQYNLW